MADTRRYAVETEFYLVDHASKALDKLGFSGSILNKTFGVGLLKAQESWKALGQRAMQTATVLGGVAVASAVTAAKKYVEFEDVLTKAGSKFVDLDVTSATYADDLNALSKTAQNVGAVTKYSASDAMGALDKMAMAGLSSKQSMALLMGTTNLATAAGLDLTSAVDMATDSLGMFNLMKDESGNPLDESGLEKSMNRIADVVAKTTNMANLDMNMWFEAAKQGASAFTSFGGSIEEFSAIAGILANSGVKGSAGGTAIRNIMLGLAGTTKPAREAIAALGIDVYDSQGKMRPFADLIEQLSKGLSGLGDEAKANYLSDLFGKENISSALLLVQEGSDKIREYTDTLKESSGIANTIARAQEKSLSGQFAALSSAIEAKQLQFGEALSKSGGLSVLEKFISIIQGFDFAPMVAVFSAAFEKVGDIVLTTAEYLKEYTDIGRSINFSSIIQTIENIDIIPIVKGLGEAILTVRNLFDFLIQHHDMIITLIGVWISWKVTMMALVPVVQGVQTSITLLGAAKTVFEGISQGVTIASKSIAGLGESAQLARQFASPLGNAFGTVFTGIASAAKGIGGTVSTAFAALKTSMIGQEAAAIAAGVGMKLYAIGAGIATAATSALSTAVGVLDALFYATPIGWIVLAIAAVIAIIVVCIKYWDEITDALKRFGGWLTEFGTKIVGFASEAWTAIKNFFTTVGTVIANFASEAWAKITAFFTTVYHGVMTFLFGENAPLVEQFIASVFEKIGEFFAGIWNEITTFFSEFGTAIADFFVGLWGKITAAFTSFIDGIVSFFTAAWEKVTSFFTGIGNGISNFASSVRAKIQPLFDWFGRLFDGIKTMWQNVVSLFKAEGIVGVFQRIGNAILGWVLTPIEKLLRGLEWVPGIGGQIKGWADRVASVKNGVSGVSTTQFIEKATSGLNQSPTRTAAEASRYSETVNTSRVELTLPSGVNASATGNVAPGVTVNRKAG